MTWLKYLGAALAAAALFVSGYKYAAALYEAEIADIQTQHALALKEKTDQKSRAKRSNWRTHGTRLSALVLSLLIFELTLTGCASSPTVIAPDCPQPAPIPAHLSESDSPAAQNFSKKVQNYLLKVQSLLKE